MTHRLLRSLAILALAGLLAPGALAQALPDGEALPGPKDPSRPAYYYGEHYDPQKYRACREQEIAAGRGHSPVCDEYKEVLPPIDPAKREHFGEFYDPRKYHECRAEKRRQRLEASRSCDIYRLRRKENPEYWPDPQVARPRLPEAPEVPTYREGMSAQEYFEALCAREAGEFILRTVEAVEGIYLIRRFRVESDYDLQDRYVIEDPFDYLTAQFREPEEYFVQPFIGKYKFVEWRDEAADGKRFRQFYRQEPKDTEKSYQTAFDGRFVRVPFIAAQRNIETPQARYGLLWRGISRPKDRELGIAGGELIVLDLVTNEVLAVRRGFIRSGFARGTRTGIYWPKGQICGSLRPKEGHFFVYKVLKPIEGINSAYEKAVAGGSK